MRESFIYSYSAQSKAVRPPEEELKTKESNKEALIKSLMEDRWHAEWVIRNTPDKRRAKE